MTFSDTRVRFAPSPTGPLHIGGLRTALFNYLFARGKGGAFILRIEDTDQSRYVPGAEAYIIDSLKWCGIDFDEGPDIEGPFAPYRQSERRKNYKGYCEKLLEGKHAYYAFDSPEELEAIRKTSESEGKAFQYTAFNRMQLKNSLSLPEKETDRLLEAGQPYVIRFRMPERNTEVRVNDLIRGEVVFNSSMLDDKVLYKSDGWPTYHLANVVDDYLMRISHVIRGEEWLPSLALHVLLYKALGWEEGMPFFAHLPLILKPGGQGKLSKRDGDKMGFPVFPLEWKDPFSGEITAGYRESGYYPDAVVNMLAFLGWNPGTAQEIMNMEELVESFSLDQVGKSGSRFDPEKARWYNQHYLRLRSDQELTGYFQEVLNAKKLDQDADYVLKVVQLVRERISFPQEIWEQSSFFFEAPFTYDDQMMKKAWKPETAKILAEVRDLLQASPDFSSTGLETVLKSFIEEQGLSMGKVMTPLRLLLVGSGRGPHLFVIMEMIGKEETIERISNGLDRLG